MPGFDGVEIHAGHDYPLTQLLSPLHNDHDDKYGGSLENRMRLYREVIAAVREPLGDESAICTRFTFDTIRDGGLSVYEDRVEIVRRIGDDVDF